MVLLQVFRDKTLPVPHSVSIGCDLSLIIQDGSHVLGNRIDKRMHNKGQRVYQLSFQESCLKFLIGHFHLNWTEFVIWDTIKGLVARKARECSLYSGWQCAQLKILLHRMDTGASPAVPTVSPEVASS